MKRHLLTATLILGLSCLARAAVVYNAVFVKETALTTNKTYTLDMNQTGSKEGFDRLSAQAVYVATGTVGAFTGPVTLQWTASNDGVNYNSVNVSSVTYSVGITTPTASLWDFGVVDYRFMKLSVVAPSAGALNLVVTVNGKN